MYDKAIYVIAKIFDQQGCIAYRCKTLNEARCLPGTLQAASAYKNTKIAVHNFASATNPSSGVKRGSNAQEECLCRCSGLYFCLSTQTMWDGFYSPHRQAYNPIYNDDIIYTPAVTVFKTDTAQPEIMDASDWYDVDVITCAAPNLRVQKRGESYK